jgi:hypothetical protein
MWGGKIKRKEKEKEKGDLILCVKFGGAMNLHFDVVQKPFESDKHGTERIFDKDGFDRRKNFHFIRVQPLTVTQFGHIELLL